MSIPPQRTKPRPVARSRRPESSPVPVANLRELTTGDLCQSRNTRLTDAIVLKLDTLNSGNFIERQVISRVRVLLELLRDSLTGRYSQLSVAAFAEVLLAMDYFIEVNDEIPDTWPRGYEDDLRKLNAVWSDNRAELARYLEDRGSISRS